MSLVIEMGWDISHYGALGMSITESAGGGAQTVSMTSGTYCHTDIQSAMGTGYYDDFATGLKAALEAASANTLTYTVSYSTSNRQYTISPSSGNVTLTFSSDDSNVRMRRLLGFSGTSSSASSHTSNQTPWGVISCSMGAKSAVADDYEMGLIEEARAGSSVYHVTEADMAIGHDFTVPMESKAATFKYPHGATSAETFTFQNLFEQLRPGQPFLVRETSENTVHQMQAQGALFKPVRVVADYDGQWNIEFKTYVKGRI